MLVLKICCSEWKNASRDKRELSVCRDIGADVYVLAKGKSSDKGRKEEVDSFDVYRYSTRPFSFLPVRINQIISMFLWARFARKLQADVITGHNLDGLFIGWLSNVGKRRKAKLVYDSHEFELGRENKKGAFFFWLKKHFEKFLIERCAFSIMVNDCISDEVMRIHKLKKRPVVVRNVPSLWNIDYDRSKEIRQEYEDYFGGSCFIIMYHGGIIEGRGLEMFLEVVANNSKVRGVILGDGEIEYLNKLRDKATKLSIMDRVLFHPAVEHSKLKEYINAADLGMVLAPATCKNHLYSLPNKFFECIQAETPVVCPNYPAMKELVDRYKVGKTCNPEDVKSITETIDLIMESKREYSDIVSCIMKAKEELNWEKEKRILEDMYKNV